MICPINKFAVQLKMEPLIRNISDTARWVATFRADESERPDAVFHDHFARMLAGDRGQQIANTIQFTKSNSWTFVARTFLFDQVVLQHVAQGYDMIINLAAGLDARPYRMDLPSSLKWIDVDLPGILEYKQSVLANEKPVCQLQTVQLDLSDRSKRLNLFTQLNRQCNKALVLSEGLIGYLEDEQVGALANDLPRQNNFRRWALDLISPDLLAMITREMGYFLKEGNSPLKFAPAEGEGFFLPYGWKILESKSKLKTAVVLKRVPDKLLAFAALPEPEGPKGEYPWTGVCLFENTNAK